MSEDFLSRWSRLKRESATAPAPHNEAQTTDSAPPPCEPASAPAIDVSSLPAIESISAESSVAAFLRGGVPAELTRAALRKAWASDPAIRDFVGIAENQWDFNGEATIAGFGSLSAEEYARHVAALALRAEGSRAAPQVGAVGRQDATDTAPVTSASAPPPRTHPIARAPVGESQPEPATAARVSESDGAVQARRTHGSALPK
jgi:Protein of unknown function (DUF3306)